MATNRSEVNIWRTVVAVMVVLIAVVVIRLGTRERGGSITIGDTGGEVAMKKFRCEGAKGNLHGACAESWWEHFWDDLDYCSTVEAACKAGGGVFTTTN